MLIYELRAIAVLLKGLCEPKCNRHPAVNSAQAGKPARLFGTHLVGKR